jgi:hypothetical protein
MEDAVYINNMRNEICRGGRLTRLVEEVKADKNAYSLPGTPSSRMERLHSSARSERLEGRCGVCQFVQVRE